MQSVQPSTHKLCSIDPRSDATPTDPPVALDQLDLTTAECDIHAKLVEMFEHQVSPPGCPSGWGLHRLAAFHSLRAVLHDFAIAAFAFLHTHPSAADLDASRHLQEFVAECWCVRPLSSVPETVGQR